MFDIKHLPRGVRSFSAVIFVLSSVAHAHSQSPAGPSQSLSSGSNSATVSRIAPAPASAGPALLGGLNFSVAENLEHDSSTGWSDFVTPDLSLRLNRHVSLDANFPWYLWLAAEQSTTINGVTTTTLTHVDNVVGDTAAIAHLAGDHNDFSDNATAAVGFPTGDKSLGIGAGTTTWHLGNHAEYSLGPFTPDFEVGIGNSSVFAARAVRKSYTAVGAMANFQAGTNVDMPKKLSLDLEAYEAMPIRTQSIFGTISRRGNHSRAGGKKTLQGSAGSGEDNGVTVELDVPLTRKFALAASYDRSLIQADDIVGFSLTWVMRTAKKTEGRAPASPLSRPGD